jgi:hypothetical protein
VFIYSRLTCRKVQVSCAHRTIAQLSVVAAVGTVKAMISAAAVSRRVIGAFRKAFSLCNAIRGAGKRSGRLAANRPSSLDNARIAPTKLITTGRAPRQMYIFDACDVRHRPLKKLLNQGLIIFWICGTSNSRTQRPRAAEKRRVSKSSFAFKGSLMLSAGTLFLTNS